jgi:hypothetical protein
LKYSREIWQRQGFVSNKNRGFIGETKRLEIGNLLLYSGLQNSMRQLREAL